ncbi:hypothetical protein [Hymenobacter mucosus]|uniref:Lipoprotein n=1 Tax=Hymenobacter mucosus TaxID=1411120 RepID=A0A238WCV3_9BACT|nr:hypothetical protein [Hymenobacter mucosus]SNR44181.1 hypothetical protein SAMN06269173_102465 [Hymenobacter mucosus]
MKKSLWFVLGGLTALATACDHSLFGDDYPVLVQYAQTGCADPWADKGQNTPAGFRNAAEQYLETRGIILDNVQINTGTADVCFACFCKTGQVLIASAKEEDVPVLVDLGFQRK